METMGMLLPETWQVLMSNGSHILVDAVDENDAKEKAEKEAADDGLPGLSAVSAAKG